MKHNAAFTLLETMVALAIFAIAIGGCVKAIETISGTISDLRMDGKARQSLENHASELRGLQPPANQLPAVNSGEKSITIKDEAEPVIDEAAGIQGAAALIRVRMTASWITPRGAQKRTSTIIVQGRN